MSPPHTLLSGSPLERFLHQGAEPTSSQLASPVNGSRLQHATEVTWCQLVWMQGLPDEAAVVDKLKCTSELLFDVA